MAIVNQDLNKNTVLRGTQIRLLDALKTICDKHNLVYWIDFGTLLGAHLQKDFIPWDDDIDVSMPIKDYKKFLSLAKQELPSDIFLQTSKTDPGYKQYFAKLRDDYSTFLEHHETGDESYHHGIYIDIFPSVFYPKMPRLVRKVLVYATLRTREKAFVLSKNILFNYPAYLFLKLIWFILSPFNGKYFAQTPEDNGYFYAMPLSYLYPLKAIEFAGKLYPAPNKVSEYLSVLYKNYSPNPPIEKRVSHAKEILVDTPCRHPHAKQKNHEQCT